MKVAFVGNICNLGYTFAKGVRQRGIEAHTFISHYELSVNMSMPAWEDPELEGRLPEWVRLWNPRVAPPGAARKLRTLGATLGLLRDLREYDLVYAFGENAIPVRFLRRLDGRPWVAHCAGSDISEYSFERSPRGFLMRGALHEAPLVLLSNQDMVRYTDRLGLRHARYLPLPIDTHLYAPDEVQGLKSKVQRGRGGPSTLDLGLWTPSGEGRAQPVLFHPTRLDWSYQGERPRPYTKGNDRLVRAFARFVAAGNDWELELVDYGVDVANTLRLCHEVGLGDRVRLLPQLDKARLVERYNGAAAVADHFDYGAMTLITLEAMSCARPVVMYVEPQTAQRAYGEDLPPVLGASTEDEIYARLVELTDGTLRARAGKAARAWILRHHDLASTAATLEAYFVRLVQGSKFKSSK